MIRTLGLVLLMTLMSPVRTVDCIWYSYGCWYYIWDVGGGAGEALTTCDGGTTFSFYRGIMGGCPASA